MIERARLPNRRLSLTTGIEWRGRQYTVTAGFAPDGSLREVFADGAKDGSDMEAALDDGCILLSVFLQTGATPVELARHLGWDSGRGPASLIGLIAVRLAELETEHADAMRRAYEAMRGAAP